MGIGLGLTPPAGLYSTSRYLVGIIGSVVITGILGASDMDVNGGRGLVFLLSFISAVVAAVVSLGLRGRTVETPE